MKIKLLLFFALVFLANEVTGQIGRLPLSPLQKVEQKIGMTDITIVYSRPSMRGREIFGGLVPYDKMWRTGANRNTTIEFSEEVVVNDVTIKSGKYAIFSVPSKDEWEIIFYDGTDNWDVPEVVDPEKIVGSIKVKSERQLIEKEVLSISIGDFTNYKFDLDISWSDTRVSIPIDLTTKKMMDAKVERVLNGPGYNDYYAAGTYEMEAGGDYKMGLEYITKAMELSDDITWWDMRMHGFFLMKLNRVDEAKKAVEEGLKLLELDDWPGNKSYGLNEFNKILNGGNK